MDSLGDWVLQRLLYTLLSICESPAQQWLDGALVCRKWKKLMYMRKLRKQAVRLVFRKELNVSFYSGYGAYGCRCSRYKESSTIVHEVVHSSFQNPLGHYFQGRQLASGELLYELSQPLELSVVGKRSKEQECQTRLPEVFIGNADRVMVWSNSDRCNSFVLSQEKEKRILWLTIFLYGLFL